MTYDALTEAKLINKVFARHKAGFRIDPDLRWRITPAFALFKLDKRTGEAISKLDALRDNIEYTLHNYRYKRGIVGDTDRTFVRANLQPLQLEVNLPQPGILPYAATTIEAHTALCGICYGVRGDTPILWQPEDSTQPHMLIAGTTGSGKTTLLQTVVLSMCNATPADGLRYVFVDFKNSPALRWLAKLPHVEGMVTEPEDALGTLQAFYDEILRRKQGATGPRRVLVIDELASFTTSLEKNYRERTTQLLHEIARLGREYQMHLIACTQKPTANVVGEQLKSNLPVRLVGMVTSPEESKTATGIAQAGAHLLPGKGAFIYVNAGTVRRFQAPLIADLANEMRRVRAKNEDELPAATILHRTSAPADVPITKRAPDDLLQVCRRFDYTGGDYPRGFVNAAMIALNGGELPTGTTFQRLRKELDTYLLTYFDPDDGKIIRFPTKRAV